MTKRIQQEPAFILHTKPFRDTSFLVSAFTQNHGHISLLARGARSKKSPLRSLLLPFTPLALSWAGKTDLPCVSQAEISSLQYQLTDKALMSGLYLNELLVRLLERHTSYPELFSTYQNTLKNLEENSSNRATLRLFEKKLLSEIGYGLHLTETKDGYEINSEENYYFEFGIGLQKAPNLTPSEKIFSGQNLLALHNESLSSPIDLEAAERLLKTMLQAVLGRKLISRELL
ncbi:MAG: DNA repair protein RecO [Gammaproteobacteria bacterium]